MTRYQQITIHRPGEPYRNEYGELVQGEWADYPARAERIAPTRAREMTEGNETLIVSAQGVVPADTAISRYDEITAHGARYRVVGVHPVPGARNPEQVSHLHLDLESVGQ